MVSWQGLLSGFVSVDGRVDDDDDVELLQVFASVHTLCYRRKPLIYAIKLGHNISSGCTPPGVPVFSALEIHETQ
jgi:hypothetical protein